MSAAPSGGAGPEAPGGGPRAGRPVHPIPAWLFPLGMLVTLEPPVLIALWAVDNDLASGQLLGIAFVGGLFISLPSLAILALALAWDRRLSRGRSVPGLHEALTGPTASRISAIALAASTILLGGVIVLLLGGWALLALPPLALSLVSAWLMVRAA